MREDRDPSLPPHRHLRRTSLGERGGEGEREEGGEGERDRREGREKGGEGRGGEGRER